MAFEWATVLLLAGTVVGALAGGGLLLAFLHRPRILIVLLQPLGWDYMYLDGEDLVGIRVGIKIRLENIGHEATHVPCEVVIYPQGGLKHKLVLKAEERMRVEGNLGQLDRNLFLSSALNEKLDAEELQATVNLYQPRLLFGPSVISQTIRVKRKENWVNGAL